jgi:hypothetical protein
MELLPRTRLPRRNNVQRICLSRSPLPAARDVVTCALFLVDRKRHEDCNTTDGLAKDMSLASES